MKKIITLALLAAMSTAVFGLLPAKADDNANTATAVSAVTTSAPTGTLERIPSPEQIKYFRVMKNENGVLFGIRLQAKEQMQQKEQMRQDDAAINSNTAASATGTLEKISSPDQIKYFKVIKKENGALFGIRLSANNQDQQSDRADTNSQGTLANAKAQLEKILAPQFINLYEKVQRIGDSLWGIKKSDDVKPAVKPRIVTTAMIECVSKAIDKKDEALKNRVTLTAEAVNTAITVRGECQKNAIKSTENQLENLQACVKDFQAKNQEIMKQTKDDQQKIWKLYQTDLKSCSALDPVVTTSADVNQASDLMIEDGGSAAMDTVLAQ